AETSFRTLSAIPENREPLIDGSAGISVTTSFGSIGCPSCSLEQGGAREARSPSAAPSAPWPRTARPATAPSPTGSFLHRVQAVESRQDRSDSVARVLISRGGCQDESI